MTGQLNWTELQNRLVEHGFLAGDKVAPVSDRSAISPELVAALERAQFTAEPQRVHPSLELRDNPDLSRLVELLNRRFCGVPDGGGNIGIQTFGSPKGRWQKGALRVSINASGCNFANPPPAPATNPTAVIMGAFGQWQAASNFFSFTFVPPNSGEDIRVVFGGPALDARFGAPGGVLGSGAYPPSGNLQFDTAETWSTASLLGVALHEIGHVLGLSHSNKPGSLMYPYAGPLTVIDAESREAINAIYGWAPQRRLADRGTSHRAMLGITSVSNFTSRIETPHMVWKGVDDDSGIYFSEFGADWTPQQRIAGVGCSYSPSLAQVSVPGSPTPATGLIMAWKGVDDDQGIYWTQNLGFGWEPQRHIDGVGTSAAPALVTVSGRVCMAWKGVEDDGGIYWSTFDGVGAWSPQQRVAGVGTTDSPALVAFNSSLYMFWKGVEGDSTAYYSFFDFANDPIWKPQRRVEYFEYESGGGVPYAIGTTGALTATVRGDKILLAWKGVEGDQQIWFSLFKDGEFSGQAAVSGVGTSVGPSVVTANGLTFMAWKGVDGDSGIYVTTL
jgi:hypothetical protein